MVSRLQDLGTQYPDKAKLVLQIKNDLHVRQAMDELMRANTPDAAYWLTHIEEMSGASMEQMKPRYQSLRNRPDANQNLKARCHAALDRGHGRPGVNR